MEWQGLGRSGILSSHETAVFFPLGRRQGPGRRFALGHRRLLGKAQAAADAADARPDLPAARPEKLAEIRGVPHRLIASLPESESGSPPSLALE